MGICSFNFSGDFTLEPRRKRKGRKGRVGEKGEGLARKGVEVTKGVKERDKKEGMDGRKEEGRGKQLRSMSCQSSPVNHY